jgi:hypothetical protein
MTPLQAFGQPPAGAGLSGRLEGVSPGLVGRQGRASPQAGRHGGETAAAALSRLGGWLAFLDQTEASVRLVAAEMAAPQARLAEGGATPHPNPTAADSVPLPDVADSTLSAVGADLLAPAAVGLDLCRRSILAALVQRLVLCGTAGQALDALGEAGPVEAVGDAISHLRVVLRQMRAGLAGATPETGRMAEEAVLTAVLLR